MTAATSASTAVAHWKRAGAPQVSLSSTAEQRKTLKTCDACVTKQLKRWHVQKRNQDRDSSISVHTSRQSPL